MIAVGSDHGGYLLKQEIINYLKEKGVEFKDFGCFSEDSCNYPEMAKAPCLAVTKKEADCALLFCGTGIGISIAANKIKGIRAAVVSDSFSARYSRLHNNANVLCLGGRVVGAGLATEIVDVFLETSPDSGKRHHDRVSMIMDIESGNY